MNINLIKIYINNLNERDAKSFLERQDILLNDEEFNYLFQTIKNDYMKIINEDENQINEIKRKIQKKSFNKLYDLFIKYKKYLK